mgnify:CR=1 FL=1
MGDGRPLVPGRHLDPHPPLAVVDPAPFADAPTADGSSRMTLYSLGFFFFWAICAGAAGASPKSGSRSASAARSISMTFALSAWV